MNIHFNDPIDFNLEIIEVDEILPSIHVEIKTSIKKFLYSIDYCGKFWLNCTVWDGFTKELNNLLNMNAILHDISNQFLLNIYNENGKIFFKWKFSKSHCTDSVEALYISQIDQDMFFVIKREFNDFPVWW